jgi:lysophospholipid acyltransferase (LPLAT)-like uncharacterized protein
MANDHNDDDAAELRNTLYRKVKRGQRRLTPARMAMYRVGVVLARALAHLLWSTARVVATPGFERAQAVVAGGRPVIPVFWHQHIVWGVRALLLLQPHGMKLGFLISPSVDGTAPAMLVRKLGAHVIRGSSTATGARALRDFYEVVNKQGISPLITPDGPRGPVHEAKPGAVMLAQLTGKPLLPVSIAARPCWTLSTWDRFELPLPFARVAIAYGEPIVMPRALDADALAERQRQLAATLQELREQARRALVEA